MLKYLDNRNCFTNKVPIYIPNVETGGCNFGILINVERDREIVQDKKKDNVVLKQLYSRTKFVFEITDR